MGRQQHRDAGRPELADQRTGPQPRRRVEAGGRLVEEDEFGASHQRHRQREPLLLAAGEAPVRRPPHDRVVEPDALQERLRPLRIRVVGGVQAEELEGPQQGVEAAPLEHQADPPPQRGSVAARVEPEDADAPAVGRPVALQRLDRRRLARPVGPEEREELARRDGEGEPVDGGPLAVALDQAVDDDGGNRVHRRT